MPLVHLFAEDAVLTGRGPYTARPACDGDDNWPFWYVAGPDGRRNVLSFPGCGAVLTKRHIAKAIAEAANAAPGNDVRTR
jgi:hypothetical protein